MNFVYSIIVNYNFPLDRLDAYILYLKLAELPKAQGGKCPVAPPPSWLRHCLDVNLNYAIICTVSCCEPRYLEIVESTDCGIFRDCEISRF